MCLGIKPQRNLQFCALLYDSHFNVISKLTHYVENTHKYSNTLSAIVNSKSEINCKRWLCNDVNNAQKP